MELFTKKENRSIDDISFLLAQKLILPQKTILPFADSSEFITELFSHHNGEQVKVISLGTATSDIQIAADKAGFVFTVLLSKSVFTYNIDHLLDSISNGDIIYTANPNKITGANFSLNSMKKLCEANLDGLIIIDEYYFDFFGISAIPLISEYDNIVILRSFAAPFGVYSSDAGYAISSGKYINCCRELFQLRKISNILRRTILATLENDLALQQRLKELHNESLRLSNRLTELGISCRITATDFILMQVASPKDVGNFLNSAKIEIENLDGYPQMKQFIRYRIESLYSNNRLINAFEKMPFHYYKVKKAAVSRITLRRPEEKTSVPDNERSRLLKGVITERSKIPVNVNRKHMFKILD